MSELIQLQCNEHFYGSHRSVPLRCLSIVGHAFLGSSAVLKPWLQPLWINHLILAKNTVPMLFLVYAGAEVLIMAHYCWLSLISNFCFLILPSQDFSQECAVVQWSSYEIVSSLSHFSTAVWRLSLPTSPFSLLIHTGCCHPNLLCSQTHLGVIF